MKFNKQVREYLQKNGEVYSIKSYEYHEIQDRIFVEGVGLCKRKFIKPIEHISDLMGFDKISGFKSLEDWWVVIERMYKDKPKFLYKVERIL